MESIDQTTQGTAANGEFKSTPLWNIYDLTAESEDCVPKAGFKWDPILSAPHANSLISITLGACIHPKLILQTIAHPKPNPN